MSLSILNQQPLIRNLVNLHHHAILTAILKWFRQLLMAHWKLLSLNRDYFPKRHPCDLIIGDISEGVRTRRQLDQANVCLFSCFLSNLEPTNVEMALRDNNWIEAMQDDLQQFKLQKVWEMVDLPEGKYPVGTIWMFRNKKDDRGIIVRNKALLVGQGFTQEKGTDYDEIYAPVARLEAIQRFLAYAASKDFKVYQIDVKCAFIYGDLNEEVYLCQPPGFEDPEYPNRVLKLKKAVYGLHQAPRVW